MNRIYKIFVSKQLPLNNNYRVVGSILCRNLSYRSDLYLGNIYPNSSLRLYTPEPPSNEGGKFSGYIPINKLDIVYSRSSGPGGQNVNTVNTKVDVRFKLSEADWIPEKTRQKLLTALQNKITKDGYFVVKSDLTRSQQLNLADALEKLRSVIRAYEKEAPAVSEETQERIRKRELKAARERLFVKRHRSIIKADRQAPTMENL